MDTYIVTGATGGIGRAIAEALIARKAPRIILACRNLDRAGSIITQLNSGGATQLEALPLDLMDNASVERFAHIINSQSRQHPVKALFNNAGIMPGKVTISPQGHESATQTNYISTRRLTELLLPALADGAAIIFTTSMTRRIARFRRDWDQLAIKRHSRFVTYGRSKKMITAYALDLSRRLSPRGIRVNCSDPGIVDSAIITLGHPVIDRLSNLLFRPLIYTPAQGAAPAIAALTSPHTARIFTLRRSRPIPATYRLPD